MKDNGNALNDRLLFRTAPSFSKAQLANVQFTDDTGADPFGSGAALVPYNGYLELVPVPEPSTWLLTGMGGLLLGYRNRRRMGDLWGQLRGQS